MVTSGTWNFNPSNGEYVLDAFNMCGIRPASLLQEHFQSARMASNLILGRWSSQGVNTWLVDLQTIPLVQGQATYPILSNTITMLDAYITYPDSPNRIITPISRSEYASYSNPTSQGAITVFWFDRLLSPTVTLYLVPDGTAETLNYYRIRQSQDANLTDGQTIEIPYYWAEAYSTALAFRMAVRWAPERATGLKALADEAYAIAIDQNTEASNFYLSPQIGGYYR